SACLSGCATVYQCETTLNADGQVERAIYQPFDTVPESARRPELWKEWEKVSAPQDGRGGVHAWRRTARIRDRLERPDEFARKGAYVAAWGRFASPLEIPDHFERKAPGG